MIDRLGGFFRSRDADEDYDDDFVDESDAEHDPPPSPVGQDERRMQVRAYNHWAGLLGERNFPDIADLEPDQLDDFGPYSVLLDLTENIDDPNVNYVGRELAAECAHDGSIGQLSSVPGRSVLSRITDHYMQIIANQAPIGFEAEFANDSGTTVLYRGILLPYSTDDQTIDFIYGVINWKEMADQQTADELLLAIDQALGDDASAEAASMVGFAHRPVETAEMLTAEAQSAPREEVLELGDEDTMDNADHRSLPLPSFGRNDEDEGSPDYAPIDVGERPTPAAARLDALGNPIGMQVSDDSDEPYDEDGYDSGIKTAADYGLPDWDEDEGEDEDVDGVVDPLAGEDNSSSLTSLVSRGARAKKSVDLSSAVSSPPIPQAYELDDQIAAIPQAYEPPKPNEQPVGPTSSEPYFGSDDKPSTGMKEADATEFTVMEATEQGEYQEAADPDERGTTEFAGVPSENDPGSADLSIEMDEDTVAEAGSPEGLYDCLAAAREMAQAAQNTEDRSRKTLYSAVARAYDFSLEAERAPEDFGELLVDNGLTYQDRAPMTPIVKLVFGADYDKTRLTEYAAVLMHAHRVGVERGKLANFLREAEGGLKGVVNAERRARKEEQGKPVEDKQGVRANLAKKLRGLETLSLADLDVDGAEFALVMVRRTSDGELEVIGEVPEDVALVERAARKLLG